MRSSSIARTGARGRAVLRLDFNPVGKELLDVPGDSVQCTYHQGPLLAPDKKADLPAYEPLATFGTEVADKGAPKGVMIGTNAMVRAIFGKGHIVLISPHPRSDQRFRFYRPGGRSMDQPPRNGRESTDGRQNIRPIGKARRRYADHTGDAAGEINLAVNNLIEWNNLIRLDTFIVAASAAMLLLPDQCRSLLHSVQYGSRNMQELVWINGEVMPLADAHIGVEDRGFQFADGVYEVVRIYDGKPFALRQHLQRLEHSGNSIDLTCSNDDRESRAGDSSLDRAFTTARRILIIFN